MALIRDKDGVLRSPNGNPYYPPVPFEEKGPMSPKQLAWIRELLESHPWRFAKTMPRNPHWYTLRHEWQDVGDRVFEEVVTAIREHGVTVMFNEYPYRQLHVGDWTYWTFSGSTVSEVKLINRKRLPDAVQLALATDESGVDTA